MGCNRNNQMIGMSLDEKDGYFRLITFDTECNILTVNITGKRQGLEGSFAGGYFFVDYAGNAIAVGDNCLQALPTSKVEKKDIEYSLTPLWRSEDIVKKVTGGDDNLLYSAMPVWGDKDKNKYWCLFSGKRKRLDDGEVVSIEENAWIVVVQVTEATTKCGYRHFEAQMDVETTILAKMELDSPVRQYNNNTFAVTEDSAVFVTNGLAGDGDSGVWSGYCYLVTFDGTDTIDVKWRSTYKNSGYLKSGQTNIGSGTTPTIMVDSSDSNKKYVVITDNAYPQMNVVFYDHTTGDTITQAPVFPKMQGCSEASVIGIDKTVFVPNNFGHTVAPAQSQYVSNEPGMAKLQLHPANKSAEVIWEQNCYTFFAMNMLARQSGIIFAQAGEWGDEESATEGAVYYMLAIDSFDGRVIWRIPMGRGRKYCHEYGGIYFDRLGDKIFVGTNNYIFSIQGVQEWL